MDAFLTAVYAHYDLCIWSQTSWRWLELKLTELGFLSNPNYRSVLCLGLCWCCLVLVLARHGMAYRSVLSCLGLCWCCLVLVLARHGMAWLGSWLAVGESVVLRMVARWQKEWSSKDSALLCFALLCFALLLFLFFFQVTYFSCSSCATCYVCPLLPKRNVPGIILCDSNLFRTDGRICTVLDKTSMFGVTSTRRDGEQRRHHVSPDDTPAPLSPARTRCARFPFPAVCSAGGCTIILFTICTVPFSVLAVVVGSLSTRDIIS